MPEQTAGETQVVSWGIETLVPSSVRRLRLTLQRQALLVDEDARRVAQVLLGDGEDLGRKRRREEAELHVRWQVGEDVPNLVAEAAAEHLVHFVDDEHAQVTERQLLARQHVQDAPGRAGHDVRAVAQDVEVLANGGAADQGVGDDAHVLGQCRTDLAGLLGQLARGAHDDGLARIAVGVDALERPDQEGAALAHARRGLADQVAAGHHRHDGHALRLRWLFEACNSKAPRKRTVSGRGGRS
jgi:hypothetical protein